MTIRILEDGDYRLQESGCIRDLQQSARVLENLSLRTYQNGATRQNQGAQRRTLQLQNCCGSRRLENNSRRTLEVGCVGAVTKVTASYSVATQTITVKVWITCVQVDILPCFIYLYWIIGKIIPPNEVYVIKTTTCLELGDLPCGTSDNWTSEISLSLVDGNYVASCALCNDPQCLNPISTQNAFFDVFTA
jgi:hypothetical protein